MMERPRVLKALIDARVRPARAVRGFYYATLALQLRIFRVAGPAS
mgnify:CR=1 FL=1